jgi:sulfur carrier protein ThiS
MSAIIEIKLFASLDRYRPASGDRCEIPEGTTVRQLIDRLGIPEAKARLVFVDGRKADWETVLQNGQRLGVFPPVGGG